MDFIVIGGAGVSSTCTFNCFFEALSRFVDLEQSTNELLWSHEKMTGRRLCIVQQSTRCEELTAASKLGAMLHGRFVCFHFLREEHPFVSFIAHLALNHTIFGHNMKRLWFLHVAEKKAYGT